MRRSPDAFSVAICWLTTVVSAADRSGSLAFPVCTMATKIVSAAIVRAVDLLFFNPCPFCRTISLENSDRFASYEKVVRFAN